MDVDSRRNQAVGLLQELGLKEYEARTFVALTRRERGTARDISNTSEVPRTRVYDAIRVLEAEGLVEVQHGSPQIFRAVPIDEAADILRSKYEDQIDTVRRTLHDLDPIGEEGTTESTHEVWTLSSEQGITKRTQQLIDDASNEIVLVVGHEGILTEELTGRLRAAAERGVDVGVGTTSEELRATVRGRFPDIETFVSELEWPGESASDGEETVIGRVVLIDRDRVLASSFTHSPEDGGHHERAVFGQGVDNALVAILRWVLVAGHLASENHLTDEL